MTDFAKAVALIQRVYDAASIHCVAERRPGGWANVYTSVLYGRSADMTSVPEALETELYDSGHYLCLRYRLSMADAQNALNGAASGQRVFGPYAVAYDVEEPVYGFRPAGTFSQQVEYALWNTSTWGCERTGKTKRIAGEGLTRATVWRLREQLAFLQETRWAPLPLLRHPEKFADLDEYWPTPISFASRKSDSGVAVEIERDVLNPHTGRVRFVGVLLRDGLIVARLSLGGTGPHAIDADADASALTLLVDDIPLDEQAVHYIRRVQLRMGLETGETWGVPASRSRRPLTVPVGPADVREIGIGTPRSSLVRHDALAIGRWLRESIVPADAERVYNPQGNPDAPHQALVDLRELGLDQTRPRVVVIDPYALEEAALEAIATIATRPGRVATIDIVTEFKAPPISSRESDDATSSSSSVETSSSRAGREEAAHSMAQRIRARLGVKVRFHRATRLHDRFLVVGERVWHVGASFNKIGEALSAVIEMHDERRKAEILSVVAGFEQAGGTWETP